MLKSLKSFKQFKSFDSDLQNILNVWNDLNGVYALTVGKTSCPNKSICWYQSA